MSKQGMKRIDRTHSKPKNEVPPVPEIQGKAKHKKAHANPTVPGTSGPDLKVYHYTSSAKRSLNDLYSIIDNDAARDNLENDLSFADRQDM